MTLRGETKVHYKMFKSGKKWVVAGIAVAAMVPMMMAPTVLAPLVPVRAAGDGSTDKSATGLLNHYFANASWGADIMTTAVSDGAFVDATANGYGSVTIGSPNYVQAIDKAGLRLTIDGDTWTVGPRDSSKNVALNSVVSAVGLPSDSVLANPTDVGNMMSVLAYLEDVPLNSMNGGSGLTSGFPYTLISGGEMTMTNNVPFSGSAIGGYSAIAAGNVTLTNNNSAPTGNVLVTDGGKLTGTGALPDAVANGINKYQFTTDSIVGKEQALKSASTAIVNKIVGDNTAAVAATAGHSEIDLDFSKAKANDNTYVFTVDATQLGNRNNDFVFTNTNAYDGYSNVLINVTGGSGATMTVPAMRNTPAGVDQVVLASTDGTTLNLSNEQFKNTGANVTVIAPTSNVILSGSAPINGFVGAINGDGSGNGYVAQPTTNNYTVQFVDVNDNKKVVGTTTVSGNAGDSSTVTVPDGWALASGASSTVTLTDTPATAIQVPVTQVKTATVTQTITSTAQKSATDTTPVTDNDQDANGNAITYPGKVADLPAAQTRTTTVQYTTEGTGDNTAVNVLSGTTGNVVFAAIEAQNVTGWLEDQSSVANTYLDENALISKLKTLDSENGSVSFDAQLIYYPSSTSVHKTLTFTDQVYFDYADDAEGDWDQLPADFDRTATVGYTETTDYNGTVTRSDFAVEDGDGLDNVTDAQIAGWTVAGYTNNADLGNFITDDGMVGLLEQSNGDTQSTNTLITYSAAEVALTVTYVDDADNGAVVGETTTLTGLTGSTGTYHATAPDKYVLAKTQSSAVDYTVTPDNSDNITVHLTHAITHTTATTTRTVNYTIEGQSSAKAPAGVTQTATWNVATDEVTGDAVYTPQSGYAVVQSPTIDGYTADGDVAAISLAATTTAPASTTTATVNYTANAETLTVHYVDDVTGAEVSTNTVAGNMDDTGTYTVVTPAHYALADGQSSSVTYTLTTDDTDDITVHLTHAVAHTTATTTRTINYVIVDGDQSKTPAATVQTVTWAVTTDEVTGTSYATAQNTYGAVTSPSVMGYTADGNVTAEVLAPTLTERLENTTTTVTYRADAASLTVHYVDDVTGEQVTSATLKGVTDGTGTYQVTVPAKYALADDQADSFGYTFAADNNDDVTVHLTHAIAYGTTTTTRTINYVVNGNADKNPASVTQTLTWSTATDEVTGAVVATPQGEYAAVKSPTVHGYTADGDVSAATVATMAATPVNAQDVTVTYSANPASLTVHYVDDVTGEQVTSATLTGVTDESGTYKVQAPTHFVLADGQGAEVDYTFATDDNDDVTVHLTHAVVHTTTTTTRTINYVVTGHADKNPATVTQTLTWNVATDEVTGTAIATPQGGYAAVTSPTVHGYTANGNVTAYNVAATTDTPVNAHNVTVTYTANPATLTVHYVDDVTGEQVTSTTLVGVTDESGTYNVQTPAHYVLADGQVAEVDYTFGTTDADDVTVHLTHAIAHTTATTTRTINYVVDGNSSKNPASVTQTLTWNVATDEVTGAVAATPQGEYAAVISPTVNGYTADGNVAAAIVTATNAMPVNAADVTVTYTANPAGLTVHYVDDVTGEQVTSATLTGVTDESGTYSVQTPTHYVLAEGQASEFDYTFATNDNDNVTVHLTHAIAHTTATTTRTINYAFADGDATKAPTTAIQTITWNVVTDEVTGSSYATPTGEYAQVDSPVVTGYTADRNVNAEALAPTTTARLANTSKTVTYHANAANLTVTYVDDVTGQTVTTHTLTGTTDATGTYTVAAPAHYVLADGQSRSINYTFAADNSDAVTVHLTHAVEHSTATTTRTINFVVDDGDTTKAPRPVVQTVTWNVATDAVTGASVATATGTYAGVDAPTVAGYTADGNVAAQTLGAVDTADLADSQVTVHYTANDAELTVTYVDDVTGDTVTTAKLTGKTDGMGTYAVTTPAHYALADGQSGSVNYTFAADDSDNVTVHLTHAVGHSTATTTRTVNYVVSGGDTAKAPASVVQTVTWNVTTDAVTGASYATALEAYGAVSAPVVTGYTADHGTDAQVMDPVAVEALADTTTTVTYTPNDADITVTYVDDTDGTTVESQTLIGQVDGTGTYTVTVPGGYQLADGQSRSINYVFATDASDNMTVHLAHHVTAGTATTTRTINYVVDGGGTTGPTSVIQTVVFATSTDDVTGLTTATAAGNYAAVATPTVAGYTADTARVTAATPQYADGDAVVTVHYAANAEQLTVRYVDDVTGTTGTTLSTDTITGTMNQSGVYTVTVPANYALADGQSRAVNYRLTDDDSDDVTVHLTHAMQYGDATTTRTINYVTADGKAGVAPASVTQVAHWRVVTDLATGGSIATATDGYAAVASPTLAGYTTSGNVAAVELGATNTAALQDTIVTVTYTAVAQPDNGGVTTPPATTPDNGGTPTAPVTAPVTTPSGTTTTTATVPVVPNVVATPTTPAVTPTTTTPVAPAVQAGSSTPATPLVATNTATPISAAGVTPDVASMAANIERETAATSVASTADAAERDVTANVGADITDALNANSTDAVAQRAVTPAGVTATILNVGEQSQNRIPGGSSESAYTYFAQKIADAQTQEAVQYELLLRQWDSGVNNWVLPSSFGITVGMQTTLMQQALRSLDSGNISINLTTSQFTDDTVVQRLSSFARNQQGQGTLTIELAELPSAAQLASVMPTYHDGGVKVVLGDAQDADSSDAARVASQLDGFKFALQKLRARGEGQQWVSAAHQWQALARDTGGTFTLEGVESDGDLQVARQMGITNVQGFLFGKPAQPTQIDFE